MPIDTKEESFDRYAEPAITPLVEISHIHKTFPGVIALDNVQFRLTAGTVHALMGENGAGKSTLMKIIAGIYIPDSGDIRIKGAPVKMTKPIDAQKNGIAMIHQELNLMSYMSVSENIWLGREPKTRLGLVDHEAMYSNTQALFDELHIKVDPRAETQTLSVALRQMVEIAKAVSFNSDVLIMDEPTSALTELEVEHLFRIIGKLKKEGKGIIYITHKMNEIFEIADELSIFRDGKYIATHPSKDVTRDDIIKLMVGRDITEMFPKQIVPIGETVLKVTDLSLQGVFSNISFELHTGEILGLAGLVGSGRSNLAETIFGVTPATSGSIEINGEHVKISNCRQAMDKGMAFLTEDRKDTGCFLELDIIANMETPVLNHRYVKMGFIENEKLTNDSLRMADRLRVKTPSLYETMINLSGGNQQKVLIARWLLTNPRILILDEPTRGIDVGAKAEIHRLVSELAAQGVAILMISSEMPEILGMSDRIMVMHEGRTTGFLDRKDANQVSIMDLAAK